MLSTLVLTAALAAAPVEPGSTSVPVAAQLTSTSAGFGGVAMKTAVFRLLCPIRGTAGTAFLEESGVVLTAYHVIEGCPVENLELRGADGRIVKVVRATWNVTLDLAYLQVAVPLTGPRLRLSSKTR